MVVEESSVVAAASLVAKFWSTRGGFKTKVISTTKVGHIHFMYSGNKEDLETYFETQKIIYSKQPFPLQRIWEKEVVGF